MSIDKLDLVNLRNGKFSCQVIANYGAALNSYCLDGIEFVDGYLSHEEISSQQYKGVILAPFPNRVAQAKYTFNQHKFTLNINRAKEGLALHGFLYKRPFDILEQSSMHCKLMFKYKATENGFPFPFDLQIVYNLDKKGTLDVSSQIKNMGNTDLPFGLGWHPYFKMGQEGDLHQLSFPAAQQLELDRNKIPTGNTMAFTEKAKLLNVKEFNFDDCFVLSNQGRQSFALQGNKMQLELSVDSAEFPYFQIYTPLDRRSIAIEPMTCAPNAFNNKIGIKVLGHEETYTASYSLKASYL